MHSSIVILFVLFLFSKGMKSKKTVMVDVDAKQTSLILINILITLQIACLNTKHEELKLSSLFFVFYIGYLIFNVQNGTSKSSLNSLHSVHANALGEGMNPVLTLPAL